MSLRDTVGDRLGLTSFRGTSPFNWHSAQLVRFRFRRVGGSYPVISVHSMHTHMRDVDAANKPSVDVRCAGLFLSSLQGHRSID